MKKLKYLDFFEGIPRLKPEPDQPRSDEELEHDAEMDFQRAWERQRKDEGKAKQKLSPSQQWMQEHPNDMPPPRSTMAAAAWRKKRGL